MDIVRDMLGRIVITLTDREIMELAEFIVPMIGNFDNPQIEKGVNAYKHQKNEVGEKEIAWRLTKAYRIVKGCPPLDNMLFRAFNKGWFDGSYEQLTEIVMGIRRVRMIGKWRLSSLGMILKHWDETGGWE